MEGSFRLVDTPDWKKESRGLVFTKPYSDPTVKSVDLKRSCHVPRGGVESEVRGWGGGGQECGI